MIDMELKENLSFLLEKPKNRCNSRYIRIHYPDDYQKIIQLPFSSFKEQLYNYIYNCPEHICPVCGKPTPFQYLSVGYSKFCSVGCSYKSNLRLEKTKQTNIKKYGVEYASQNKDIKEKKRQTITKNYGGFGFASEKISEKRNNTLLERYGTTNTSSLPEVKEKVQQTMLKHYGVPHYLQTDINRERLKQYFVDTYGVTNPFQLPQVQEKIKNNKNNKTLKQYDFIDSIDDEGFWYVKCPHSNCNKCQEKTFRISRQRYWERKAYNAELCTKLLPIAKNFSSMEVFVRRILDKYHIEYQTNVRDIISPKELDIYIPSHNLAVECNGVYWHNSYNKESQYHYEKFKACQDKGIQLLTFWEDQYRNKPQIIESILLSKLKIYNYSIGARECRIQEVTQRESSSFISMYHIQGPTNSKVRLGMFYKDELVSVMTFSHRKGGQGRGEITWVLDRYCVKSGYKISGGASRLMKYFIKKYKPETITSFASNDISTGDLYEKLGFTKISTSISYWYIDSNMNRYHRSSFTKHAIVQKGWKEINSKDWTEAEVTKEHGLNKIYDSGTTKYIYYETK